MWRKIKIEIAVSEKRVDTVTEIIKNAAHTGKIGDGKIFATPVEEAVRVRTGKKGEDAI